MAARKKTASKKKAGAKKAPARNPARKKASAKKVPSKKNTRKKSPAKKSPAKKSTKKTTAKSNNPEDSLTFEPTLVSLAKRLGVTRQTIDRWKKIEGAPKPRSDGRHCVEQWRKFMSTKDLSGKSHDLESLRARDLLAKCEEREFKNAIKRGEYVSLEEVRLVWGECCAQVIQLLEKSLMDEQPPILAGMDNPIDIRQNNERVLNEVRRILHSGEGLTP